MCMYVCIVLVDKCSTQKNTQYYLRICYFSPQRDPHQMHCKGNSKPPEHYAPPSNLKVMQQQMNIPQAQLLLCCSLHKASLAADGRKHYGRGMAIAKTQRAQHKWLPWNTCSFIDLQNCPRQIIYKYLCL